MTKAELIKALDGVPDDTAMYVWGDRVSHDIHGINICINHKVVHLNIYDE